MKPLQIGILSASNFFQKKIAIPVQKSPLIQWAAIASRSEEKAKQVAKKFGISKAYGSYEALLADATIDAVYIPMPNHLHAEWIRKAADAGKHILCEKPIALNAEEAKASIDYAHNRGVKVMEAFMYRFHPQWQHVKELIAMQEIGKVLAVHCFFGFNNTDPNNIRNIKEAGGGAILDIGCYAVSSSRFVMGTEPKRVISLVERDKKFDTDVLTSGILDFGMIRATFTVSIQVFPYQRVFVYGSGGNITVDIPFNAHADVELVVTVTNGVGTREIWLPPTDQYILEFEAFAEAIQNDKPVPTPPEDAINNMKVLDALFRSEQSGSWEQV
jgi:predicted dehydrogenase